MNIGFIGLGNMGMPMALNLHKSKRIDLLGYDVSPKSLKQFKSKKGKATSSLDELIKFSDVIITCVPGPKQIKALSIGKGKISDQLGCLLYTSPSPRDLSTSRMPSSA